ncbi:hypothetical protein Desaci_0901 [Desulfosporosinus acidiphilus SJ4]|uniref:Uncharacterized protein n=1 Tax=Desulfosporosinus acidiphilus (strain DSM 22704 / JCM 16185 / SJ4) TaxID=646529 RepID=I4D2C4_DESAJ|nr:hypothetical protein [Desulfosporosinus acidiphilus]AFM39948.1 hypothetical protein Desaci_0901 [Desulfosporosinus acidiphilus SJ4]
MIKSAVEFLLLGLTSVLLFIVYERLRFNTGKEMLTEKMIRFLERIHQKTAPNYNDPEMRNYKLSEKVIVKEVYFQREIDS